MTYTIKKTNTSENQILCQFSDGTTSYYIKFANTKDNIEQLNSLLDLDVSAIEPNKEHALPTHLPFKDVEESLNLVATTLQKNIVPLSEETKQSIEGNPVLYTYRDIDQYREYWQGHTPYSLFSLLSEDIIEMPYADAPDDYIFRFGNIAFHNNHGTNHAIRQYILVKNFLDLIKREGKTDIKNAADKLSSEEKACIELAAFLFRSGRTNESGWSGDPTYGQRSAEIFITIASDLGFDHELIGLIAQSYDYHSDLEVNKPLPSHSLEETTQKAQLFRTLLKLSHESDLVRCETNSDKLNSTIQLALSAVLADSDIISKAAGSLLNFAAELCRKTGTRIDSAKHQKPASQDPFGNNGLSVKTAHNVVTTCNELNTIRPCIFPKSQSPTQMWFESEEHVYKESSQVKIWGHSETNEKFIPSDGWTTEQIGMIPTKACMTHESEHIDEYVSVYHATTKASRAFELLCKALAPADKKDITWHRISPKITRGITQDNIERMKSTSLDRVDNEEYMAWHLLSCNPTLWHNADFDSQESTVDYFLSDSSVTTLDFSSLINDMLDERRLLIGQGEKRKELADKFNIVINDPEFGKQGVIYQYLIPHHLVDEIAYISGPNGKLDIDNPSALDTLYSLKTPGTTVPNMNTLQVRLLIPKLMDPDIASQLKVKTHSTMSGEIEQKFEQTIMALVSDIPPAPEHVVSEEDSSTKGKEKTNYSFNVLSSLSDGRISDLSVFKKKAEPPEEDIFDEICPLFDPNFSFNAE